MLVIDYKIDSNSYTFKQVLAWSEKVFSGPEAKDREFGLEQLLWTINYAIKEAFEAGRAFEKAYKPDED
jgi:hypothetical protein